MASGVAYALGGDDFCVLVVALAPLGLPLPDRGCGAGGGGGGAAAVLWAVGDVVVEGGRSEPYDGRSWGAGERAMAIAALMIGVVAAESVGDAAEKWAFDESDGIRFPERRQKAPKNWGGGRPAGV